MAVLTSHYIQVECGSDFILQVAMLFQKLKYGISLLADPGLCKKDLSYSTYGAQAIRRTCNFHEPCHPFSS